MSTLTLTPPVRGVSYDKNRPETRQAWLDQRRGGITATEIRDWGVGSKRRGILDFKVTGEMEDLSSNPYVNHGNLREPIIAEYIEARWGITPCDAVYSHGDNPRHLASPDGISLDPLTGELLMGGEEAVLAEIKTSKHDLHPGRLNEKRELVEMLPGTEFERSGYYAQMQWQMYVMQATRTLFVWERREDKPDPETGLFMPAEPPQHVWIMRDEKAIERLLEVAERALAEIDAARAAVLPNALPPVSDFPAEQSALVLEYRQALEAESRAKKAKAAAWEKLQALYLGEGKEDFSKEIPGVARVTVSTTSKVVRKVNEDKMRQRAPKIVERYENLRARYTEEVPETKQGLTITAPKKKD